MYKSNCLKALWLTPSFFTSVQKTCWRVCGGWPKTLVLDALSCLQPRGNKASSQPFSKNREGPLHLECECYEEWLSIGWHLLFKEPQRACSIT